jgi:hypothetical protein
MPKAPKPPKATPSVPQNDPADRLAFNAANAAPPQAHKKVKVFRPRRQYCDVHAQKEEQEYRCDTASINPHPNHDCIFCQYLGCKERATCVVEYHQ